jgi:hypothetical protein
MVSNGRVGPGVSQRKIPRGSFAGTMQLIARIDAFVTNYNNNARPIVWTAAATKSCERSQSFVKLSVGHDTRDPM